MTSTGLCATCTNVSLCTFPRKPDVPVMHCLDFEGETLATPHPTDHGDRGTPARIHAPQEPGLCPWCEYNSSCTYPRAPSGVWFCEEYL